MKFKKIFIKRYFRISDGANRLIKAEIDKKKLSRTQISSLAGVSRSYVDHFIRNDRNFREDQLERILPLFNVVLPSKGFSSINTTQGKFINLPSKSSPELMQILGYFLGDGTAQPKTVRFKDVDKNVLMLYCRMIKIVFNIMGRVVPQSETKAYLLEVNSVYLSKWLRENVVLIKKEFLKKVNKLSRKELSAFLRGLFDAEGFVAIQSRQIRLGITNEEIGKSLPVFFSKLGIRHSFYKIKRREINWKDIYLISLDSYEAFEKFYKFIGFSSEGKNRKLKFLILRKSKRKVYQHNSNLCVA
ncbi:MAG: LAGLIDADG family homing endonuclease [Candidatus Nealsonbacteria bacterium]